MSHCCSTRYCLADRTAGARYFNQDWRVMAFSDVVKWLDGAKLTFVASADFMAEVGCHMKVRTRSSRSL